MVIVAIALPLISVLLKICASMIKKLGVIAQYVMKEVFLTLVMYLAIGLGFMSGLHLNYERKYYAEYKDAVGGGRRGCSSDQLLLWQPGSHAGLDSYFLGLRAGPIGRK